MLAIEPQTAVVPVTVENALCADSPRGEVPIARPVSAGSVIVAELISEPLDMSVLTLNSTAPGVPVSW